MGRSLENQRTTLTRFWFSNIRLFQFFTISESKNNDAGSFKTSENRGVSFKNRKRTGGFMFLPYFENRGYETEDPLDNLRVRSCFRYRG